MSSRFNNSAGHLIPIIVFVAACLTGCASSSTNLQLQYHNRIVLEKRIIETEKRLSKLEHELHILTTVRDGQVNEKPSSNTYSVPSYQTYGKSATSMTIDIRATEAELSTLRSEYVTTTQNIRQLENSAYNNTSSRPKTVYVRGYYRKDGTYVRSHYRSRPRR